MKSEEKGKTFVAMESFLEGAMCLDEELRNEVCYVIFHYGIYGTIPECSGYAKGFLIGIKKNIDNSKNRYEASVKNGKKGGRPSNTSKPKQNLNETKTEPNSNLDKDIDIDFFSPLGEKGNLYHNLYQFPSGSSSGAESPDSPARKSEEVKTVNNQVPVKKYGGYRI